MNKITFSNTTLTCTFQKSDELLESQCLIGVFSKTPKGFRFEEAIPRAARLAIPSSTTASSSPW